jgi:hypothetical protein
MPVFNGNGPLTIQVSTGTTTPLFSTTDTVANLTNSRVLAPLDSGASTRKGIMFTCNGATVAIMGSNTAPTAAGPQQGVVLSATLATGTSYQDINSYAYYWAVASAATPVSVIAHVN